MQYAMIVLRYIWSGAGLAPLLLIALYCAASMPKAAGAATIQADYRASWRWCATLPPEMSFSRPIVHCDDGRGFLPPPPRRHILVKVDIRILLTDAGCEYAAEWLVVTVREASFALSVTCDRTWPNSTSAHSNNAMTNRRS